MLLHENTNTANFPPYTRRKIYEVEQLVRIGQRVGVNVYTNMLYESDFLQWEIHYNIEKDELYICVRSLDNIEKNELYVCLRSLDSISVPVERHEIGNLSLSQLAAKLAELELIY